MRPMNFGKVLTVAASSVLVGDEEPSTELRSLSLLKEGDAEVHAPADTVLVLSITTAPPVDTALIS